MSPRPISYAAASDAGLIAIDGEDIHTFSNGTEGEYWMAPNCFACRYWPPDGPAGEFCALEAALLLGLVSQDLASRFGWTQTTTEYGPRSGWRAPDQCPCFASKMDDDGNEIAPEPPPDPHQLNLLADPTEDAALLDVPISLSLAHVEPAAVQP